MICHFYLDKRGLNGIGFSQSKTQDLQTKHGYVFCKIALKSGNKVSAAVQNTLSVIY